MTSAGLRHIAFNNVLNFGRAGRPRPAANQTNTMSFRGEVEKSPAREMPPAHPRQPTCLRRLCARQSPKQPFPLPARNIVASPLWLKTVTCGLFLRHFVPPRRASAIPTVVSLPRNDKLYTRVRQFIRINIIKPSETLVPPCHCERSGATSWKRRRARRTRTKISHVGDFSTAFGLLSSLRSK